MMNSLLCSYIHKIFKQIAIISSKVKKVICIYFFKQYLKRVISNQYVSQNRITSFEDLYQQYPKLIHNLFESINLNYPGLEITKKHIDQSEYAQACQALIDYYHANKSQVSWRNLLIEHKFNKDLDADHILNNDFTFQLVSGNVPLDDSKFEWSYRGPTNDSEWAWFLNRHYHISELFDAYLQSGNSVYVQYIYHSIYDWVLSSISVPNLHYWAQWRGREVACRILFWAPVFYGLLESPDFSPIDHLLMLAILPIHGRYLRHCHSWGANWLPREMNGLATLAVCWPELKYSGAWLSYAQFHMFREGQLQVYPDGAHKELTSHYHWITLQDFDNFSKLLFLTHQDVPSFFQQTLENMWSYMAFAIRPDGCAPLNNDSDRDDLIAPIKGAAQRYGRSDWLYIVSNGQEGSQPSVLSAIFPWAGQIVMRSSWAKDAYWAFFDVGPNGINYHTHNDKLHLSVSAFGRDLLVDAGRFHYKKDDFWRYFRNSASHNTILIDGKGQNSEFAEALQPIEHQFYSTPLFDFAYGQFDKGYQDISDSLVHSRFIVYLKHRYWIVIDRIATKSDHEIQALWHFHPDCDLDIVDNSVVTTHNTVGNLRIIPASNMIWAVQIAKGTMQPIQGWWSEEYNHKKPSPTVIYSSQIRTTTTFAWVLFPTLGATPVVDVQDISKSADRVRLQIRDPSEQFEVSVCLDEHKIQQSLHEDTDEVIQIKNLRQGARSTTP